MRLAKKKTTPVQHTSQGMLNKYYAVQNNHVFGDDEEDVTTVDGLFIFTCARRFDYGVFRDSIRDILVPNWAELMFEDRKKCVQHYRYPTNMNPGEWEVYFTPEEHERNWNLLTAKTREVRLNRLFAAFQKISYRLTEEQVAVIYMVTKEMCYDYYYANLPHVLLWLQNGKYPPLGIDYTNNGFAQMSGFSVGLMMEILDIFVNGNYQDVNPDVMAIGQYYDSRSK